MRSTITNNRTLICRCLTIVLLGLVGKTYAYLYIVADLGLYLFIKIARNDFWYWAPAKGVSHFFLSVLARIITKLISDFTSIVQLRHPNEVGGAYWIFSVVLTMVSLPLSITFFDNQSTLPGNEAVVEVATLSALLLVPCTSITFFTFFFTLNKGYRKTFLSLERGKDVTIRGFKEGQSDGIKATCVFKKCRKHWISIENDVKAFVTVNWVKWQNEKPKWLTLSLREKIPLDFIPIGDHRANELARRLSKKGSQSQKKMYCLSSARVSILNENSMEEEEESEKSKSFKSSVFSRRFSNVDSVKVKVFS